MHKQLIIEKGIPIPPKHGRRLWGNTKYNKYLRQMEIGDSVFIAYDPSKETRDIRSALYIQSKRLGIKVTFRNQENPYGIRMWRTE